MRPLLSRPQIFVVAAVIALLAVVARVSPTAPGPPLPFVPIVRPDTGLQAVAALRPLPRHNDGASCLYSFVQLILSRAGLLICVFMWVPRVFDPKPTVRQIRATPD